MALKVEFFDREDEVTSFTAATKAVGTIQFPEVEETTTGCTITISDGTETCVFEITRGGSAQPGNIAVNLTSATTKLQATQAFNSALANSPCAVSGKIKGTGRGVFLELINPNAGAIGNQPIVVNNFRSAPFLVTGMHRGSDEIPSASIINVQELPNSKYAVWYDA